LINGLSDGHRSCVPVLAIAAHAPSSEIGSGYFQETHPERLFIDCSAFCEMVSQPDQVPRLIEIAVQTAIARSDVSVLVLPGDIALREATQVTRKLSIRSSMPSIQPSAPILADAPRILNERR